VRSLVSCLASLLMRPCAAAGEEEGEMTAEELRRREELQLQEVDQMAEQAEEEDILGM
jgi:hypothetical protein